MFLIVAINNKLIFTSETFRIYERIAIEWIVFILAANIYAISVLIELKLLEMISENRDLAAAFPEYAEIYNSNTKYFMVIAV
mmetsp:Transcript_2460/g.2322  ORF Transcript_2460/g.2322 Transcript_2460/m.2322 type:complete len:82 (+) Transcript_2460:697-942(+)